MGDTVLAMAVTALAVVGLVPGDASAAIKEIVSDLG